MEEAPKPGEKLAIANPEDCPEEKPNPVLELPNCELLPKPKLTLGTERYAGGSPGGGGGLINANGCADDDATEVAMAELAEEGKENGLLKGEGELMESAALGDVKIAAFLLPPRATAKVTPSFKMRDEPMARAVSKLSLVSNQAVPKGLPGMCLMPTIF